MAVYAFQNQSGSIGAPAHHGGILAIGPRPDRRPTALKIQPGDDGGSFSDANRYRGEGEPWCSGGRWVPGGRTDEEIVAIGAGGSGVEIDGATADQGEGNIGPERVRATQQALAEA